MARSDTVKLSVSAFLSSEGMMRSDCKTTILSKFSPRLVRGGAGGSGLGAAPPGQETGGPK